MNSQRLLKGRRGPDVCRSLLAALVAVAGLSGLPAFAGGSGGGDGNSQPGAATGDDVTSLPLIASEDGAGTVLVGRPAEIEALVRGVRGQGTVDVFPRSDGEIAVLFTGDWALRFDRFALETSRVRVLFLAGADLENGSARLVLADSGPLFLQMTEPTLALPLADLARAGQSGIGLDLTVAGADGPAFRTVAFYRQRTVTLFQRAAR